MTSGVNIVIVRWFYGDLEEFDTTEVRLGSDMLFMRLTNGEKRQIPLRNVMWFGLSSSVHCGE